MEKSFEVKNAVSRLTAMADVKPELAPVVGVALEVVKSAREEAEAAVGRAFRAEERARLAEETLAAVTPHVNELADRAESAERSILQRSAIDAAREMQAEKAEAHRKAWTPTPTQVAKVREMAAQVEDLRAGTVAQAEGVAKAAQIITVIHRAVKNEDGKSPVQCFEESGEWTVSDYDGAVIAVLEKRSDAVQLVSDLIEEELAELEAEKKKSADQDEMYQPQDTIHRPEPWRRKKLARVEQPPATSGIEHGASKRKRKQARIL